LDGKKEYNLYIDGDSDGTADYCLRYTQNTTFLTLPDFGIPLAATTNGAYGGNVVEMSLANAANYLNPDEFCVYGHADTDWWGAEDYIASYIDEVCYSAPFEGLCLSGYKLNESSGMGLAREKTRLFVP
jgi:hypothetical protein